MPARRHLRFALGALVILLLLLAGGGAAYWRFRPGEQQSAHRLSIVVLPLTNLSNEPEQEYFAEAVTDDLAADLARIEDSFVIAPSTARAYKGIDPKRVGHELGVRYILDGSLRRTESKVRVSVLLISTETGAAIWSDSFEGDWSRSMQLQDLVTGRLARRLDLELTDQESRNAEIARPNNPNAVDLAMRGWAVLNQPYSRGQLAQSLALFERALQIRVDGSRERSPCRRHRLTPADAGLHRRPLAAGRRRMVGQCRLPRSVRAHDRRVAQGWSTGVTELRNRSRR